MESHGDIDDIFEEYERMGESEAEEEPTSHNNQTAPTENAERVPVPKRVIKNPRLKFNAERLVGERGIPTLTKHFKDVTFRGKGHEKEDLNRLLTSLEHWTHRLFPSMRFEDCLRQIEKLGKKRPVQTCVTKIRLDMPILHHNDVVRDDDNDEPTNTTEADYPPEDAFDQLFMNVENDTTTVFASTAISNKTVGNVLGSCFGGMTLTEEQKRKMERNRMLAVERRKVKLAVNQTSSQETASEEPAVGTSNAIITNVSSTSSKGGTDTTTNNEEFENFFAGATAIPNNDRLGEFDGGEPSSSVPAEPESQYLNSGSLLDKMPSPTNSVHNSEELELDDLMNLVEEDESSSCEPDRNKRSSEVPDEKEVILNNSDYSCTPFPQNNENELEKVEDDVEMEAVNSVSLLDF